MSEPAYTGGRLRAYLEFLAAILYFFLARSLAFHGARGLAGDAWFPLVEQAMLVFLLLLGYAAMGFWFDRQADPIGAAGIAAASRLAPRGRTGPGNRLGRGAGLRAAHDGDRRHRHLCLHSGFRLGLARGRCGILCAGRTG